MSWTPASAPDGRRFGGLPRLFRWSLLLQGVLFGAVGALSCLASAVTLRSVLHQISADSGAPSAGADAIVRGAIAGQLGIVAAIFLVGATLTYFQMSGIARPLERLARHAGELAQAMRGQSTRGPSMGIDGVGSPDSICEPSPPGPHWSQVALCSSTELATIRVRDDEIGHLARVLDALVREAAEREHLLETARTSLVRARDDLERRVQERTAELAGVNRELAAARDAAESASRAKSTFLLNMSHELRTPLNHVIGYAELLRETAEELPAPAMLADLDKIREAAKGLLGIIDDVLDLSSLEAGKVDVRLESLDLASELDAVLTACRGLAQRRGNRFEVELPADVGPVRADADRLRQVLFKLLYNAFKFTEQGLVRLEAVRRGDGSAGFVELRVSDTGQGLTPAQREGLFQPFAQGDGSSTRRHGGVGLGLAISRRLTRMMGGDLTAQSEPGQGSVFTVHLQADVSPGRI